MAARRLTFVALSVSNLAASVEFYRTLIGLPLRDESHDEELNDPWYGGSHAAYSWTDGAFLHFAIYPSSEPQRPVKTAVHIGFHVEEFDKIHKRIQQAEVSIVQEPREEPWGKTARYLDPDDNIVSITSR